LAIVDTQGSIGAQPYHNKAYAIAFNGEIFNYKQLQYGHHRSEVAVLGDLMHEQHDLAQLLNGYYAIAFYDISRDEIVLARDFYGVMPLYYVHKWGFFEAASEPQALLCDGPLPIILDDIKPVPANSKITYDVSKGTVRVEHYSSLYRMTAKAPRYSDFMNAVHRTAKHSEVGFSVALSGGLDSSMVLAALHFLGHEPAAIITTYVEGEGLGAEAQRAKQLVDQLGWTNRWMCVPVQQHDVRSRLPYANPIRDFAFQRHATVAKHSPTKVILCGEGADELGLGYPVNKALTGPVERYLKKVSLLKSQASMTLDRVNMAGMMYSKEYRVPFLDLEFSLACLGHDQTNKELFRKFAHTLGVPKEIIDAAKYSNEETTGRAIAYD
jgi:asparagine synthase (glutamine-hydrolysing)